MAFYKFTGRIKNIGVDKSVNFCEFDVDNRIKIEERQYGIAYEVNSNFAPIPSPKAVIVEKFTGITTQFFDFLLAARDEKIEVVFCITENNISIVQVTILK